VGTSIKYVPYATGSGGLSNVIVAPGCGKTRLRLTPRQSEILPLIAAGFSDKEIASRLHLSRRTVRTHLEKLFRRYGFKSRAAAVGEWLGRTDHAGKESGSPKPTAQGTEEIHTFLARCLSEIEPYRTLRPAQLDGGHALTIAWLEGIRLSLDQMIGQWRQRLADATSEHVPAQLT
jgi:DNA-binding CsgD family transcriptional regulator